MRIYALAAVLAVILSGLAGCGGPGGSGTVPDVQESLPETDMPQSSAEETPEAPDAGRALFAAPDGTSSIELDSGWTALDLGADNWFGAVSPDGVDGMFLMQFPKMGNSAGDSLQAADIGQVIVLVESSYGIDHMRDTECPEIPGMTVSEAVTCTMEDTEGGLMDGYVVYGETDFAFYAIACVSLELSDEKIEEFKKVCASFAEYAPRAQEEYGADRQSAPKNRMQILPFPGKSGIMVIQCCERVV